MKKSLVLKIKKIHIKRLKFKSLRKINKRKFFRTALFIFLLLSVCVFGIVLGAYKAVLQNLPSISRLEEFEPNIITYIFSDEGEVVGEYAKEKRIVVSYEEIPEVLINAIIATEDPRFYKHKGIDFLGILRAVKEDIKLLLTPRKLHGGSTISQQLIRRLLLHRKQTVRRKLKEVLLALQIEKRYSKREILALYCNQFDLGHGACGVEAASRLYFDKKVSELNLEEAALITGIFRGPYYYSPYREPELTLRRRNHVLNRMIEEGYITKEEGEEAKMAPMNVLPLHRGDSDFAAYFNEEVRRYLEENYGADALYNEGLKVYTTINPTYQKYAEEALRNGLRVLDKRQGWRKDKRNLSEQGIENLEELEKPFKDEESGETMLSSWLKPYLEENEIIEAVVLSVERREAKVKVKEYTGKLTNKDIAWTKSKGNNLKNLIREGDVIHVKIKKIDEEKKELLVSLDQEPILEGAFFAIEPQTGQIKAMVGGYSFKRLKFNQATQALRQPGSVIKPIIYTAALENGYTPATRIVDEPTEFIDKWSGEPWSPRNYDQKYKGTVTLRIGLEESRNIVTAKLLDYISPQTGVDYCRKFGITSPVYPYLSLSLGTFEMKLIELVSAFTTFPNKGIRITPYFITRIEDKDGNILEECKVESEEVISPQIAYIMTSLLQGVVQRGTGWRAAALEKPLCGKTGTTDEHSDAWFIGFSPSLCAGVWVGHEKEKKTIGDRQSGAVAAQPIWIEFFRRIIEDEKRIAEETGEEPIKEEFKIPSNLTFVTIDYKTGLIATPFCLFTKKEVFIPGSEPKKFCSHEAHMLILDYYSALKKDDH
ncbi:MAG: PBP1A family penicillin-binding protein [Candidatus Aminicenantes bacterium]|nr:MAG: PBP1A family penicillin-binding protein [Candidatus Aminicenantes bacterium]